MDVDPLFKGSITEFRIYNGALTAEEVEENNKAGPDKLLIRSSGAGQSIVPESPRPAAKTEDKEPNNK